MNKNEAIWINVNTHDFDYYYFCINLLQFTWISWIYIKLFDLFLIYTNLYRISSNLYRHGMRVLQIISIYYVIECAWVVCSNSIFRSEDQFFKNILKKNSSCDMGQIGQDDGQVNPSFSILVHFRKHSFELIPTCTNHKVTCVQTAHRISTYPLSMYWDLHCCGPVSRQRRATRPGAFAALRNACCAVPHPWCSHPTCQW